jgi:hypothetical protein
MLEFPVQKVQLQRNKAKRIVVNLDSGTRRAGHSLKGRAAHCATSGCQDLSGLKCGSVAKLKQCPQFLPCTLSTSALLIDF